MNLASKIGLLAISVSDVFLSFSGWESVTMPMPPVDLALATQPTGIFSHDIAAPVAVDMNRNFFLGGDPPRKLGTVSE